MKVQVDERPAMRVGWPWLAVVLAVAFAARVYRLDWGLPGFVFPDDFDYFLRPAAALARGNLIPESLLHPPLLVYVLALVDLLWSASTGQPIPVALRQSPDALYDLALLGRIVCVFVAVASVAALYLLARRLLGARPALIAAAAFALSPLHVLESHRVNPDGALILFALLAAHQAILAADRKNEAHLYAAFVLAGLAAGAKYTGLAAVSVPIWIGIGWKGATFGHRLRLCAAGSLLTVMTLALILSPAAFDPARLATALEVQLRTGYREGVAVPADGWLLATYGRFPLVLGPYLMGWAMYLLALAGIAILAVRDRRSLGVVAIGVIPFLLVQGSAVYGYPRWYLPVVPYLCLCAGSAIDRLWHRWPRAGVALGVLAISYTAALTASQCARLGLEPQRELAAWLHERATQRRAGEGRLVVSYPSRLLQRYDPLGPILTGDTLTTVYTLGIPGAGSGAADPAAARRWLSDREVDLVILPSFVEALIGQKGGQHALYGRVVDGTLGLQPIAEFRSGFLNESLYVWADPSLSMHWATGINGYKVFAPAKSSSAVDASRAAEPSSDTLERLRALGYGPSDGAGEEVPAPP